MKFTISDCISRINQALNYPALSYEDVSHYFDQAIAELNTSLRIALPTVTEMRSENTFKITNLPNAVILSSTEPRYQIYAVDVDPNTTAPTTERNVVYYRGGAAYGRKFYILKDTTWEPFDSVYGIIPGDTVGYVGTPIDYSYAVWSKTPLDTVADFSLTDYLPTDWIILFLIPYVCFKFAVRSGDDGAIFRDEFTQGFQQLQTSYGVPNKVALNTVAHLSAYKELVNKNIANLLTTVPTRAITESMRITNGVRPQYGDMLFDSGGWGV